MLALIWLVGCGAWDADPVRSTPVDPHVELSGDGPIPYTLVWSDLAEMFPPEPGMIRPLEGVVPGMSGEDARARLLDARIEGARTETGEVDGHATFWSRMKHGDTEIGVTLVLDSATDRLRTVDLAIDWGAASAVLADRWGDPEPGPPLSSGGFPLHRWDGAPWVVVLHRLPGGNGVVQYQPSGGDGR